MAQEKELKNTGKPAKEFLKEHGKAGTKIRYADRKKVVVVIDNHKHYKKDQVLNPHTLWADKLIADKIAKAVKE